MPSRTLALIALLLLPPDGVRADEDTLLAAYTTLKERAFSELRRLERTDRDTIRVALRDLTVAATLYRVRGDDGGTRKSYQDAQERLRVLLVAPRTSRPLGFLPAPAPAAAPEATDGGAFPLPALTLRQTPSGADHSGLPGPGLATPTLTPGGGGSRVTGTLLPLTHLPARIPPPAGGPIEINPYPVLVAQWSRPAGPGASIIR